jgi:hypothetical protein
MTEQELAGVLGVSKVSPGLSLGLGRINCRFRNMVLNMLVNLL